jgi:hypothetical protein
LINSDDVSFVGAWTLFGFHEDGFTSGIRAAEKLGAKIPFEIVNARYIRGKGKGGMSSRGKNRWDEIGRILLIGIHSILVVISKFFSTKEIPH